MALKNVVRVTLSLPKVTVHKLEMNVPKSRRSKYIAGLIEKDLKETEMVTLEDIEAFWDNLAKKYKPQIKKSSVQMQREDRKSH